MFSFACLVSPDGGERGGTKDATCNSMHHSLGLERICEGLGVFREKRGRQVEQALPVPAKSPSDWPTPYRFSTPYTFRGP